MSTGFGGSAAPGPKKPLVGRPLRHVLLLGLDGAGKTALAKALAAPEEYCFPTLPTDLELQERVASGRSNGLSPQERVAMARPYICRHVDDRLLIRKATDNAPLTGIGKVPPPVQVITVDCSGVAAHRRLWTDLLVGGRRCGITGVDEDDEDYVPVVLGVVFVISAHDTLRAQLSWTELLRLLSGPIPEEMPVLIAIEQVDAESPSRPRMSVADLLKIVEDFAPIPVGRKGPVTIMGLDLRAVDPTHTGGAAVALGDLRQVASWMLAAATNAREAP